MDGAFKGDITATKNWMDHHDDKRTAQKVDGPPKRLKFFTKSIKWMVMLKVKTTTKWTDSISMSPPYRRIQLEVR